jgi:mono/diheme cytochrome c family protein
MTPPQVVERLFALFCLLLFSVFRSFLASPSCASLTCAMHGGRLWFVFIFFFAIATVGTASSSHARYHSSEPATLISKAHVQRGAPTDLEIGGDLASLPAGATRYLSREELLKLPQVAFTVTNDPNFTKPTEVSGVLLETLVEQIAASPEADLAIAICSDQYRSHYARTYLREHHPLLVLKVNGQAPERWPKDSEGHGLDMGPYMISHQDFKPAFKVLAHSDEPQIPWGVVRIDFRDEKRVWSAIAPQGTGEGVAEVQDGYRIAQQNCFRCHNMNGDGGTKAHRPWLVLAAWAESSPEYFAGYVRNPQAQNPHAQMTGNPGYDDATLQALIAYFRTFSPQEKP